MKPHQITRFAINLGAFASAEPKDLERFAVLVTPSEYADLLRYVTAFDVMSDTSEVGETQNLLIGGVVVLPLLEDPEDQPQPPEGGLTNV